MVHTCNPSPREAEAGGFLLAWAIGSTKLDRLYCKILSQIAKPNQTRENNTTATEAYLHR